ncbi:FAD:protein FMN transferase [Flintibacter sp.]|uniref:FAD:protein FMN transferase n=1 Tax=Flintibacter sp. TaxID=1918624 RepID=UPI003D13AA8D|nr:FAD:protein FMN transferase [Flintibacter sp.]
MKGRLSLLLAGVLAAGAVLTGCGGEQKVSSQSSQVFAMDTVMLLTVYGDQAQQGLDQAEQTIQKLEKLWSATDENSEIWALNHSGGNWVELSEDTREILSRGLELCALTDGALDITAYSAVQAWGFPTGVYRVPDEAELERLVGTIDYTQLELDEQTGQARLPEDMSLDLGAVAKGRLGEVLSQDLKELGVTSALLELGGNIQTVGTKPDGSRWRVGIQDPNSQEGGYLAIVEVADQAVVTSGDYQRYFEQDGQTYCHIMDPATAAPADSGVDSVSIVGSDGTVCDALSTALFVMGEEKGAQFWKDHPEMDFEAIFVSQDGSIAVTEGLEEHFTLADGYQEREVTVIHR